MKYQEYQNFLRDQKEIKQLEEDLSLDKYVLLKNAEILDLELFIRWDNGKFTTHYTFDKTYQIKYFKTLFKNTIKSKQRLLSKKIKEFDKKYNK